MDDRTRYLLEAKPLPLLLQMATPNSVAFLIQVGVSMAEIWFVGRLGTASLASLALVFPLLMLMQTMSGGAMGGAVTSAVARALGSGDPQRAAQLMWHAIVLAFTFALLFLLLFAVAGERFLQFLGGRDEVLQQSLRYCLVLFACSVSIWLLGTVSAIFRGMGDMRFPALMMMVSAAIQVPLSGVLVLGAFGVPQLGVVGAAVSAVTAATVVSVVMLLRLSFGDVPVNLAFRHFSLSRAVFRDILKVFVPASMSPLLTVVTIISLTAMVGRFGESALAGYGIGSRIEFLIIPLVFGLGAAMTSLVGTNIGAGQVARAEHIGWLGGSAAAIVAGVIGIGLALLPGLWVPVFAREPEIQAAATSYIQIVGPGYLFMGMGLALYFASQGAGAMRWPVLATAARVVIAVGGASLLAFWFDQGLEGIFVAALAGMVVYGLMIAASLKLGAWRPREGQVEAG